MTKRTCALIVLNLINWAYSAAISNGEDQGVFLTVSSLAGAVKGVVFKRQLELNWHNVDPNQDYQVALFNEDPVNKPSPVASVSTQNTASGTFRTNISYGYVELDPKESVKSKCLGYYIALMKSEQIITSNCLRSNPTWIYDNREALGSKTLLQLLIPGTHQSGSYIKYDPKNDVTKTRYLYCQEESVLNQLMYGIRHLDIRPSYRTVAGSTETLWLGHGPWITNITIRDVINQVKTFMEATNEIVIFDFHHFENGFTGRLADKRHKELIDLVVEELSEYAVPVSYGNHKTLNELWSLKKRLFIGYADNHRDQSDLLYNGVRHLWGDTDTLKGLEDYLNSVVCSYSYGTLWSTMAELTPKATGLLFDTYGGLRKMAQTVNLPVTQWVREKWWYCANIVATDFFLGNDIINVAISSNLIRG